MTDAEIIKALECFAIDKDSDETYCVGCAFETKGLCCENCSEGIAKASLDLINRQKAEIERLSDHFREVTKKIRAEAIKEFAERFESKLNCIPQHHFTLAQVLFDLDKTKKEMAGDAE